MNTATTKVGSRTCLTNPRACQSFASHPAALTSLAPRLRHGGLAFGLAVAMLWSALAVTPLWAGDTNRPPGLATSGAKPYPIDYCLICGDHVGGTNAAVVINYQGQELKFCCKRCVKTFKQDPTKYLKKLHEAGNPVTAGKDAAGAEVAGH